MPVSTALWPPKWYGGDAIKQLAPPTWLLRKIKAMSPDQWTAFWPKYCEVYNAQLQQYDPWDVISMCEDFGEKTALLCWCGERHHCHRGLIAEWIQQGTGLYVPEYGQEEFPIDPEPGDQLGLF